MLFKTVHGSHLYGLAHADSDNDFYMVVPARRNSRPKYAKQSIIDGVDTTTVDLPTWQKFCQDGVPQALEAMFAPQAAVVYEDKTIKAFRAAFRTGPGMRDKYYRTIDNFLAEPDFKKNRHALRLALNLREGLRYGRFNPTLSKREAIWVTYLAKNMPWEEFRAFTLDFANK